MFRALTLLLFVLCFRPPAYGSMSVTSYSFSGHVFWVSDDGDMMTSVNTLQMHSLLVVLDSFCEKQYPRKAIKIVFNSFRSFYGNGLLLRRPKYTIAYHNIKWSNKHSISTTETDIVKKEAVVIYCDAHNFDVLEILKLVQYGFAHSRTIQQKQKMMLMCFSNSMNSEPFAICGEGESKGWLCNSFKGAYDFVKSVDQKKINTILRSELDDDLNELVTQKYFFERPFRLYDGLGDLGVYWQKGRAYVYPRKSSEPIKNDIGYGEYRKLREADIMSGPFFNLETVRYVISDRKRDYFFGVDDSTFFYFDLAKKELKGPYVLPALSNDEYRSRYLADSVLRLNEKAVQLLLFHSMNSCRVYFDAETGRLGVDSSSFYPHKRTNNTDWTVDIINRWEKEDADIKSKVVQQEQEEKRIIEMVLLGVTILLASVFLATTKRL